MKIELKNIGRGKVCKIIETDLTDLTLVEHLALKEACKYLMSKDVWLVQKGERFPSEEYNVYAGGRNVGEVIITLSQSALN